MFNLAEVAREALDGAAEAASDKGLSLRSDCAGCQVRANRDMLCAVLRNLISNAIKFTLPGGSIAISARRRGEGIEIAVADTGVGIPPNQIDDLLKLDRRVTTSGTAGERGSGLGLLLCRDLLERQGGEANIKSTVDRGTTFLFTLPDIDRDGRTAAANASRIVEQGAPA